MRIFSKTDTGLVRSLNDDAFLSGYFEDGSVWAVVCDGIGGFNAGAVASASAVRTIGSKLSNGYIPKMSGNTIRNLLSTAINAANIEILDEAKENISLDGMGTTVVAAIISEGLVHIAYAGDSRAYLFSKGDINRLTNDHSVVQMLIDCGELTESEAADHPRRNLITRALGIDDYLEVDYCECPFGAGDKLLLCTDGLTNAVRDSELLEAEESTSVELLASHFIDMANKSGGADNATAVIVCD